MPGRNQSMSRIAQIFGFAAAIIALWVGGCAAPISQWRAAVQQDIAALHGPHLETLRCPTLVTALRISPTDRTTKEYADRPENDVVAGPVELTASQVERIQSLVFDLRGFHSVRRAIWRRTQPKGPPAMYGTGCQFLPTALIRFERGDQTVEVLVCPMCKQWRFIANGIMYAFDDYAATSKEAGTGFDKEIEKSLWNLFPHDLALAWLVDGEPAIGEWVHHALTYRNRLPLLIAALGMPQHRQHHEEIAAILARITRENFGLDRDAWRNWWIHAHGDAVFDFKKFEAARERPPKE